MYSGQFSRFLFLSMLAASLLSVILSSCGFVETVTGITPTPVTPSPTLTPTLYCPPMDLDIAELKVNSTFVVVLFDEEITKSFPLVYENGQTESEIYVFLSNVLPSVLGPGSEYSLFRLGYRSYEEAKIIRDASRIVSAPELVSTPAPLESLTAIPTPAESGVVMADVIATKEYATQVAQQYATATQMAIDYQCQQTTYEGLYRATEVAWDVTQVAEKERINEYILTVQPDITDDNSKRPLGGNNVYEGLSHVTIDLESRCPDYSRCVLIVIDDLEDWRSQAPEHLDIDLEGYEIVLVAPSCSDTVSPECKNLQNKWMPQFTGAFRSNSENITFVNSLGSERKEGIDVFLVNYFSERK